MNTELTESVPISYTLLSPSPALDSHREPTITDMDPKRTPTILKNKTTQHLLGSINTPKVARILKQSTLKSKGLNSSFKTDLDYDDFER